MAADLAYNLLLSMAIITYAVWTVKRLKIRLNFITRIKWVIAFFAILMRVALTIDEFVRREYRETAFMYYYLFLIDQAHFMIILTLFFTVIGSWRIMYSFSPEMRDKIAKSSDRDFQSTMADLRHQKKSLNQRTFLLQGIYIVMSLALTIMM